MSEMKQVKFNWVQLLRLRIVSTIYSKTKDYIQN